MADDGGTPTSPTRDDHLFGPGPKRILSLDGGGIRGTVTLGYLDRIESMLRERYDRPDLVLADYFDLIGGTSTGSILAAALATGRDVAEVRELYFELGPAVFASKAGLRDKLAARYSADVLERELHDGLGDLRLGDPEVRTGLCIVAKRADTWSVWPLHNHPGGRYGAENAQILLRDATRASTAAPTFFTPVGIELAGGEQAAFVDGAVSTATNPALQLLVVATADGFGFRWPATPDDLLLVSVGTGRWEVNRSPDQVLSSKLWDWATEVPNMLMQDTNDTNQMMLQFLGQSPAPRTIDSEIGDLDGEYLGGRPILRYVRYDLELEHDELESLDRSDLSPSLRDLRQMDRGENARPLYDLARAAAERDVAAEHLPERFDLA